MKYVVFALLIAGCLFCWNWVQAKESNRPQFDHQSVAVETSALRCELRIPSEVAKEVLETITQGEPKPAAWVGVNGGPDTKGGFGYRLGWRRDAFSVSIEPDGLRISTMVYYGVHVRARPWWIINPLIEGSTDDNRRVRFTAILRPKLRDDWSVNPDNLLEFLPVELIDSVVIKVPVAFFSIAIDVTGQVRDQVNQFLTGKVNELRQPLADRLGLRARVEEVWRLAQQPIHMLGSPDLWLDLNPTMIGAASPKATADGRQLEVRVGLVAQPSLSLTKPVPVPLKPLVENSPDVAGEGDFDLAVRVRADLARLQTGIDACLPKLQEVAIAGHRVRVRGIEILAHGSRLLLRATLGGDVKAIVYLTAEPRVDGDGKALQFDNVTLDVESDSLLLKLVAWWKKADLEQAIRGHVHIEARDLIAQADQEAKRLDGMALGETALLHFQLAQPGIRVLGVASAGPESIEVIFAARGRAAIDLRSK